MSDLIKRSDAIKSLDNAWINGTSLLDANEAVKQLNDLPSADRPQGWIPCSERLPEEEGEYLVTAKKFAFDSSYYDVQIAYCSPNKKWFRISNCEIVAWMPLPEPYREGE